MAVEITTQLAYYLTAGGIGAATLGIIGLVASPATCRMLTTLGFFGGVVVALGHPSLLNLDLTLVARLCLAVSAVTLAGTLPELLLLVGVGSGDRSTEQHLLPGLRLALVFLALYILGPKLILGVFG